MREADAIKAYRERLSVKTKHYDINIGTKVIYEMPIGIRYERNDALMEEISLSFRMGGNAVTTINITKLELADGTEKEEEYKKIDVFGGEASA